MRTEFAVVSMLAVSGAVASPFIVSSGTGSVMDGDSYDYIAAEGTGEIDMTGGESTASFTPFGGIFGVYSVAAYDGGIVRMSGGSAVSGGASAAVGAFRSGRFYLSGGTVNNVWAVGGGYVEVNGGTVLGNTSGTFSENGGGARIDINGGMFTGTVTSGTETNMRITGGTFQGLVETTYKGLTTISGGTFESLVRNSEGHVDIMGGLFQQGFTQILDGAASITGGRFLGAVSYEIPEFGSLDIGGGIFEDGIVTHTGAEMIISARWFRVGGQTIDPMIIGPSSDLLTEVVRDGITYNALLGLEVQWLDGRITTLDVYSQSNSYRLVTIPAPGVPAALGLGLLVASRRRRA